MRTLKEKLLYAFEQNRGEVLSGQALADTNGVSRAAIWKAVQGLRQEGHVLEAVTNGGYQLLSDQLSEMGVLAHLGQWPAPVVVTKETGSTNRDLLRLAAEGAPHGTLVLSEQQTEGRGRAGKPFFSPEGAGLYMSVLIKPRQGENPTKVTVAAAVAACRAMEPFSQDPPRIKWVNDVFLRGKKSAGILTEAFVDLECLVPQSIVMGIGINIYPPKGGYPPELDPIVTCLFPDGRAPKDFSRCRLAADMARAFLNLCDHWDDPGMMEEYRQKSFLLGRDVTFWDHGNPVDGVATGINEDGNLLVETDRGTVVLQAGEVRVRGRE